MGVNGSVPPGGMDVLKIKIAEDHARQKAAYNAGWNAGTAGMNRGGAVGHSPIRGRPSMGGSYPRGGYQMHAGGEDHSRFSGQPSFSGYPTSVRQERPPGRYESPSMGYGSYQWS